jgi:hypothetical protein
MEKQIEEMGQFEANLAAAQAIPGIEAQNQRLAHELLEAERKVEILTAQCEEEKEEVRQRLTREFEAEYAALQQQVALADQEANQKVAGVTEDRELLLKQLQDMELEFKQRLEDDMNARPDPQQDRVLRLETDLLASQHAARDALLAKEDAEMRLTELNSVVSKLQGDNRSASDGDRDLMNRLTEENASLRQQLQAAFQQMNTQMRKMEEERSMMWEEMESVRNDKLSQSAHSSHVAQPPGSAISLSSATSMNLAAAPVTVSQSSTPGYSNNVLQPSYSGTLPTAPIRRGPGSFGSPNGSPSANARQQNTAGYKPRPTYSTPASTSGTISGSRQLPSERVIQSVQVPSTSGQWQAPTRYERGWGNLPGASTISCGSPGMGGYR